MSYSQETACNTAFSIRVLNCHHRRHGHGHGHGHQNGPLTCFCALLEALAQGQEDSG